MKIIKFLAKIPFWVQILCIIISTGLTGNYMHDLGYRFHHNPLPYAIPALLIMFVFFVIPVLAKIKYEKEEEKK